MVKQKFGIKNWINLAIVIAAAIVVVSLILRNLEGFGYAMVVALGFGAVIMIHEFGHFIVAKVGGIKVEAFSIGFPPTLLGIQKTDRGIRFRILPNMFNNGDTEGEGGIIFTLYVDCKPSDTEYRIGLIPFGGFVAMLGQSDSGAVEDCNDPRSFANKPVSTRIAVVIAGVTFNVISAVIIFMFVFLVGLDLPPAEVGSVLPGSPADIAELRAGDRIVSINGDDFVDFTALPMAAALSKQGEEISLMVKRPNDSGGYDEPTEVKVVAKISAMSTLPIRAIGITQANTLKIAEMGVDEDGKGRLDYGLIDGDVVVAVNGTPVGKSRELEELVAKTSKPNATLTVERVDAETGETVNVDVDIPLFLKPDNFNFETGHDIAHIYSMVPRLKISDVVDRTKPVGWKGELQLWWRRNINKQTVDPPVLFAGDIIVKVGETVNPTYTELRTVTAAHKDKAMAMAVLRKDEDGKEAKVEVTLMPRQQYTRNGDGPVTIGIYPILDAGNPVLAKTISVENGPAQLDIPSGALITAVDGEKVGDFFDIMRIIRKNRGKRITIDYRISDEEAGDNVLNIPTGHDNITVKSNFDGFVPFEALRETFKATGPIDAIGMGVQKTYMFVAQTIITLKRLFSGEVSPTTLSGPLGIVTASYNIASSSMSYYIYFLGLISSCIAVMNLLPLPVVDGGVIVLLIIEKIKGSPISQKVQGIISYAGVVFILALFGWLIFNDALNIVLT